MENKDLFASEGLWSEEDHVLVLNKLKEEDRAKFKQLAFGHFYGQKDNIKDLADLYMKVGIDVENHLINGEPPTNEILLLC